MLRSWMLAAAVAAALAAPAAQAWGPDGHRITGALAAKLIKGTRAEREVAALLKPGETLESIANWADCARGTLCGPQSEEMQAFVAAFPRHTSFHFSSLPFQHTHYADGGVGTHPDDIVQTLKRCVAVLQGQDGPFSKRQALLLLVHLVGDLHQPFHVAAPYMSPDGQYVDPQREADIDSIKVFPTLGTNNFQIEEKLVTSLLGDNRAINEDADTPPPPPGRERLHRPFHSFWDGTVVKYAMKRSSSRSPDDYAQQLLAGQGAVAPLGMAPAAAIVNWADASIVAARQALQGVQILRGERRTSRKGEVYYNWYVEVAADYPVTASTMAKTQLNAAGQHLAALLQGLWPNA
ncbi:S1/P1 nuclease [Massilia sp. TS11]|uniref:S1/P1 nuclease n=1 Tax=Massilia sp. TS11 TaxID=2908003 RepID=UPI001EDBD0F1|nr:S1/P1 nuclease [Massilia sp. TS11]MCG2586093.1 S1/P1 nuclease [Massilia sp. TS11]